MSHFNHYTPIQVRFVDLDSLKHVNNANYMSYMEIARMEYFQDVIGEDIDWKTEGIILAQATVDFKKPILLMDEVKVGMRCSRLGNKSFDLAYTIIRKNDNNNEWEEVARGHTVMVAYNYSDDATIAIPERWKEKLIAFEGEALHSM